LIPVGFGYGDGDEFFMRGWVWDSETRPRPAPLPSLHDGDEHPPGDVSQFDSIFGVLGFWNDSNREKGKC